MPLPDNSRAGQKPLVATLDEISECTSKAIAAILQQKLESVDKIAKIVQRYEDQARNVGQPLQEKKVSSSFRPPKKVKETHPMVLSPNTMQRIESYRVRELQDELRKRGEDTKGLKKHLKERLIFLLENEKSESVEQQKQESTGSACEGNESDNAIVQTNSGTNQNAHVASTTETNNVAHETAIGPVQNNETTSQNGLNHREMSISPKQVKETLVPKNKHRSPFKKVQNFFRSPVNAYKKRHLKLRGTCDEKPISTQNASENKAIDLTEEADCPSKVIAVEESKEMLKSDNSTAEDESKALPKHVKEPSNKIELESTEGNVESNSDSASSPAVSAFALATVTAATVADSSDVPATSHKANDMSSYIITQSIKAKNEARMAKLAEMRSKNKSAQNIQPLGTSTLSINSVPINNSTAGIRQLLTQKMRVKASNAAVSTNASAEAQSVPKPTSDDAYDKENNPVHKTKNKSSAKVCQPDLPMSPLSTYDISSDEGSYGSDSDESDYYKQPKDKKIPSWASGENFQYVLKKHLAVHGNRDMTKLFGRVETCDLDAIFPGTAGKYKKRTSSANWSPSHPLHPSSALSNDSKQK